jgi:non-ribosomal peptide synthase protein (TIGR01720 family)
MSTAMDRIFRRVAVLSSQQRAILAERLGVPVEQNTAGPARLVAYVVAGPAEAAVDPAELRGFLKLRLPEHMVPTTFVMLPELPRTPGGKIDVRALPAAATQPAAPASFVAPVSAVEAALAEIWSEVLGGVRVGVHDNFFEIGGDSILSIQVVARAARHGLRLAPDQLFRHQTIAELAQVVGTTSTPTAEQGLVEGAVPLTPIQHWFREQPLSRPGHWHHVLWIDGPADLDSQRFERALHWLLRHHDALRLRFEPGAEWRQWLGPADAAIHVEHLDLGDAADDDADSAMHQAADALAAATDPGAGSLVSALIVERVGKAPRIALIIHHMAVDPLSWQVLLDDLDALYTSPEEGAEPALPPKTTSFRAWANALVQHARSERVHAEADYWLDVVSNAAGLPRDLDGPFTEASAQTIDTSLAPELTRALLDDVPAIYGTHTDEVLLTALVRTTSAWTGMATLYAGIERHGREQLVEGLDLSRTVGWFTSFFPVALSVEDDAGPGDALKAVKEQLRRVPGRGVGYGLLRYLRPQRDVPERLHHAPEPQLVFNYAGRGSGDAAAGTRFRPAGTLSSSRAPDNRRSHMLEINAFPAGSRLVIRWTYSGNVHYASTIERVAARFLDELQLLIEHCATSGAGGYTPSDFPEAGLSQAELDRLLQGLGP